MSRADLIKMARHSLAHAKAGTIEQESEVLKIPAAHYYDPARWREEVDKVFKRMPLMLAVSAEMKEHGSYKSMEAAGVPVSLCGEAAGRPIDAMALIGLGLRSISMRAASIGAVKMMVRSLDLPALQAFMEDFYDSPEHSLREALTKFAEDHGVAI